MKRYLINLLILFSQTINVVLFAGHPDQTVSARAYENQEKIGWAFMYDLLNAIFFWQSDHCKTSYLEDLSRAYEIIGRLKP